MNHPKRVRVLGPLIPLAVLLVASLPGCGGGGGDSLKASDGTALKTPDDVLKEAMAKGAPAPKAPGPAKAP
jgi:hypothetical protein